MNLLLLLDMAAAGRADAPRRQGRRRPAHRGRAGHRRLRRQLSVSATPPPWPTWAPTGWPSRSACSPLRAQACRSSRSTTASATTSCTTCWPRWATCWWSRTGAAAAALATAGHRVVDTDEFVAHARAGDDVSEVPDDGESPALLLYTSGTTAAPKAAVLRHRHLTSYVIGTVEFGGADPDEAVLVSVPPYHVAGLANLLSNLYLGRRIVYLRQFDAAVWVETVRREAHHPRHGRPHHAGPHLRRARRRRRRAPQPAGPVLRRGPHPGHGAAAGHGAAPRCRSHQRLRPDRDELDHRRARTRRPSGRADRRPGGDRPARRPPAGCCRRSRSRCARTEQILPTGEIGEIWVRGEQVSGEYAGVAAPLDAEGWFPTRDRGWVDADGYLFIEGRSDDTIIRGGENIAPAEIEEVLLPAPRHRPVRGGRRARRRVGPAHRRTGGDPARCGPRRRRRAGLRPPIRCEVRRHQTSSRSRTRCPTPKRASSSAVRSRPS